MSRRALHADLAICNAATPGPWQTSPDGRYSLDIVSMPEQVVICSTDSFGQAAHDGRFIAEARTGWPHAIERALKAEAERDELRKIVSEECPIAAFDIVTSLRAEKAHMMERVAELEAEVERLRSVLTEIHLTRHDKGEIDRDQA